MELRDIVKPSALFVAIGIPAAANAATTINVDYNATSGAGTQILIGAAAAPQFNFNVQPGGLGGTKSYLNANSANDATARVGFPGSPAAFTSANTSAAGTFSDFSTDGNYSLLFSVGSNLYSGTAVVDQQGRHISSITYDAVAGAVPEPETWALMILGLGGIGVSLRRRRQIATPATA